MIPVARNLLARNHNIFVGSGEEHSALFRNELPGLSYIEFTGFKPGYSRFIPQYLALLLKMPLLLYHIIMEHYRLKRIVRQYDIDIVISDNRFGLWNSDVTTVYVTHMPLIPFPKKLRFLEFAGAFLHSIIIKKYSFCFIPDLPGELNVSGRLSHGIRLQENTRYIGILSRFNDSDTTQKEDPVTFQHNTVILSGPEPQREILKQKLVALFEYGEIITVFLEGKPGRPGESQRSGNVIAYNHLPEKEMIEVISGSNCIITRSGYTTIMELISLNCNAVLIPTPGQTEQEYLAEYLAGKGWFQTISQSKIKEGIPFPSTDVKWSVEIIKESKTLLNKVLDELLEDKNKDVQQGKSQKSGKVT
jgi:hypothetical protein